MDRGSIELRTKRACWAERTWSCPSYPIRWFEWTVVPLPQSSSGRDVAKGAIVGDKTNLPWSWSKRLYSLNRHISLMLPGHYYPELSYIGKHPKFSPTFMKNIYNNNTYFDWKNCMCTDNIIVIQLCHHCIIKGIQDNTLRQGRTYTMFDKKTLTYHGWSYMFFDAVVRFVC